MQYPGYNSGNVNLVEGEWYHFKIHNLVLLQDESYYYVLTDINGMKHFMPSEYYSDYKLNIGDEILCKIDRINCTGRIFLEPAHPFYKEGEIYLFNIESYQIQGNDITLLVKGIIGNSIKITVNDIDINSVATRKTVSCNVQNIKKGELILEFYNTSI
jgi:hypothetical protein